MNAIWCAVPHPKKVFIQSFLKFFVYYFYSVQKMSCRQLCVPVWNISVPVILPTPANMTDRICQFLAVSGEWLAAAGAVSVLSFARLQLFEDCRAVEMQCW